MGMDQHCFDLDAYFARIGHSGPRAVSLTLLRELVAHHSAAIAFENIDPLARRVPPLDLASVQRKLVTQRRGGYCYEQNTLFQGALLALGFQVTGLMARVRRGVPPHIMTPRSHMLLLVDLPEGPHLADVGYGARVAGRSERLAGPGIDAGETRAVMGDQAEVADVARCHGRLMGDGGGGNRQVSRETWLSWPAAVR